MQMSEIRHLSSDESLAGRYRVLPEVIYSTAQGRDIPLTLVVPWAATDGVDGFEPLPLVVFVQGSGWKTPNRWEKLPDLCLLAQRGYVVAAVDHRNCVTEDAPAPVYLVDVKCAIRYLRSHAAEYGIDPTRVAVWGTSSGGNTVQLVGVTGDLAQFKTSEWADESDAVQAVVSCFGPSDMVRWMDRAGATDDFTPVRERLFVGTPDEQLETKRLVSPLTYVTQEVGPSLPKFLLLLGTDDAWVDPVQLERMHEKLQAVGASSEAYFVDGGVHEGNFWSAEVLDTIFSYLGRAL